MTARRTRRSGRALDGLGIYTGVVLVIVTTVLAWFAFAAAYGVGVGNSAAAGSSSSPVGNVTTPVAPGGPDFVYLSIDADPFLNASSAWADAYTPANFSVPAHTLVVFQVENFDTGENPVSSSYANVSGTVGNVAYLNGSATGVHSVKNTSVGHTFSFVYGPYAGFNVPMVASNGVIPTITTFYAYFNTTGSFVWNCMAPCAPGSMDTPGFMMGTMTVVA